VVVQNKVPSVLPAINSIMAFFTIPFDEKSGV